MGAVTDRLDAALESIEEHDELRAFVALDPERARAEAAAADDRSARDAALGPLDGTLVAVKDTLDTAGLTTTFGSPLYRDRTPATDAEVVRRLRAAGAVIVGKTNCTELACGTVGTGQLFGDPKNPRYRGVFPGGSSSGSAVAVAAGLVNHAIGSDTGGSIRIPAAACGVVGLKPTFGRVSNEGASVCARILDHIGPITATVAQSADTLRAIQSDGNDDPGRLLAAPVAGLRVGVLLGAFIESCDDDVLVAFERALVDVDGLGCELGEVDLGFDLEEVDAHANMLGADLFASYGADISAAAPGLVGDEVLGWAALYEGVDRSLYDAALAHREMVIRQTDQRLADWDVVLCPTMRSVPVPYEKAADQRREQRTGNCAFFDMAGNPSLSFPHGETDTGLPVGLMITGRRAGDATVLQLGAALERATAVG